MANSTLGELLVTSWEGKRVNILLIIWSTWKQTENQTRKILISMKLFSLFLFCLMRNLLFPSLLCLKKKNTLKRITLFWSCKQFWLRLNWKKKHCQEHKRGYFQTFEHQCISRKISCQYLEITIITRTYSVSSFKLLTPSGD